MQITNYFCQSLATVESQIEVVYDATRNDTDQLRLNLLYLLLSCVNVDQILTLLYYDTPLLTSY